jgi:hypothetical protein
MRFLILLVEKAKWMERLSGASLLSGRFVCWN